MSITADLPVKALLDILQNRLRIARTRVAALHEATEKYQEQTFNERRLKAMRAARDDLTAEVHDIYEGFKQLTSEQRRSCNDIGQTFVALVVSAKAMIQQSSRAESASLGETDGEHTSMTPFGHIDTSAVTPSPEPRPQPWQQQQLATIDDETRRKIESELKPIYLEGKDSQFSSPEARDIARMVVELKEMFSYLDELTQTQQESLDLGEANIVDAKARVERAEGEIKTAASYQPRPGLTIAGGLLGLCLGGPAGSVLGAKAAVGLGAVTAVVGAALGRMCGEALARRNANASSSAAAAAAATSSDNQSTAAGGVKKA